MKETDIKLDVLLSKAGQKDYYQFLMTFLFALQMVFASFFNESLPFIERVPYVFVNNSTEKEQITYEICNNKNQNYTIDEKSLVSSIPNDFNIYCDETKIFLIGFILYFGMIIGLCITYLFVDKIGRKKTIIIFIPIHIFLIIIFKILDPNILGDCLNIIYINIFLLGVCSQIIIITLIIYICEIIKQSNIPIFIILVLTGIPLSGLLSSISFTIFKNINWRDLLLVLSSINILVYVIILFNMVGSPIFALNNGEYGNFIIYLMELCQKNSKNLVLSDFEFLYEYLTSKEKRKINKNFLEKIKKINQSLIKSNSISTSNLCDQKSNLFLSKSLIKENYLLSAEESTERLDTIIGGVKMRDYSPLDLIRFQKQVKNFLILSFLWSVTFLIKNGIQLENKTTNSIFYSPIINYIYEILSYYLILSLILYNFLLFHQILISLQLISFIIFLVYLISSDSSQALNIFLFNVNKICWSCLISLLYVVTSIIYPTMIRTKGLSYNIAVGILGSIIPDMFIGKLEINKKIEYFLIFEFFSLTISYGLPNKIGTFILESPSRDNTFRKNSDISEIGNSLFVDKKEKNEDNSGIINNNSNS